MDNVRYFSGARAHKGRMGVASEIMRIEILKKGKLPPADRYKSILRKKMDENKKKATSILSKPITLKGVFQEARGMSKKAEQALQQVAQRKAKKEAKALRQMVIVEARRFPNGNITAKGKIYDVAGNVVGQVNTKSGQMSSTTGWQFGKYKPKSYFTHVAIQNAINLYSPYFINLRKQQLMQQQGVVQYGVHGASDTDTINVWGGKPAGADAPNYYGTDAASPRQNVAMTAWGVRSDNAWGTFADNSWGTFADNVWGGNYSDVWGGIGGPGTWGQKGPNVWGTGNGRNYLSKMTGAIAGFFGFSTKKNRDTLRGLNKGARTAAAPARAPSAPRSGR